MERVREVGSQLKEQANPFYRLVVSVTQDDGVSTVTYYLCEKVKEAVFQSDHACETVHRALMGRLDVRGAVMVLAKSLYLIKFLMLEGPASFCAKISTQVCFFAFFLFENYSTHTHNSWGASSHWRRGRISRRAKTPWSSP